MQCVDVHQSRWHQLQKREQRTRKYAARMEDINRRCGAAATHHGSSQHAVQQHHAAAVKDAGPLVGAAPIVT